MLLISLILKIESESSQLGAQLLLNTGRNHSQCSSLKLKRWESSVSFQSAAESWGWGELPQCLKGQLPLL